MRSLFFKTARAVVALELFYLLGTAFLLNCGLLEWWLREASSGTRITFDFAYSFFPGRLAFSGLDVEATTSTTKLSVRISTLYAALDLAALFRKEIRVRALSGARLTFRYRTEPARLVDKKAVSTPAASSVRPFYVDSVSIEQIDEVAIEGARFRGVASLVGKKIALGGDDARGSLSAAIRSGTISSLNRNVAGNLTGRVELKLRGREPLEGKIQAKGDLDDLSFLNVHLASTRHIRVNGGKGPIDFDFHFKAGRIARPSHLKIEVLGLNVAMWDQRATGDAGITWEIAPDAKPDAGVLAIRFTRFQLRHVEQKVAKLFGEDLEVIARSPDLMLGKLFKHVLVEAHVRAARLTDLSYFQSYLPAHTTLRVHGGSSQLSASVYASSDVKKFETGQLSVQTDGARLSLPGVELKGDMELDGILSKGDLDRGRLDISGSRVSLRRVEVDTNFSSREREYREWWGSVALPKARLTRNGERSLEGDVEIQGRDGRPIVAILTKNKIPSLLMNVLSFSDLGASLRFAYDDRGLRLYDGKAHAGGVRLRGWLAESTTRDGKFLFEYGPFAVGVDLGNTGTSVILNDAYGWFGRRALAE